MHLDIVAPTVWQGVAEPVFAGHPPEVRRSAWIALRAAHDHHIGLTPTVARDFAVLMPVPSLAGPVSTRNALAAYLVEALALARGASGDRSLAAPDSDRSRRLWRLIPHALVLQMIVLPAARMVNQAMGRVVLFGDAQSPLSHRDDAVWRGYAGAFDRRFPGVLERWRQDGDGVTRLLHGFALQGVVQRRLGQVVLPGPPTCERTDATALPLPSPDPALVALLATARPRVATSVRRMQPPRPVRRSRQQDHQAERPREEGVVGIRVARSIEEVDGMLLSEHLNPPPIKLDRLLNNEFLVYHRPPRRVPRRTVLLVGIVPQVLALRQAALAKVAWIEAMVWIARTLWRADCRESDIRWVEARADGVSVSGYSLDSDGPPPAVGADTVEPGDRIRFTSLCGWTPDFLDRRPNGRLRPVRSGPPAEEGLVRPSTDRLPDLMAAACGRSPDGDDIGVDDYAIVHAFVLMGWDRPGTLSADALRQALVRAHTGLGLGHRPKQSTSLTVIPAGAEGPEPWCHIDDQHGLQTAEPPDPADGPWGTDETPDDILMGRLIDFWTQSARRAFDLAD